MPLANENFSNLCCFTKCEDFSKLYKGFCSFLYKYIWKTQKQSSDVSTMMNPVIKWHIYIRYCTLCISHNLKIVSNDPIGNISFGKQKYFCPIRLICIYNDTHNYKLNKKFNITYNKLLNNFYQKWTNADWQLEYLSNILRFPTSIMEQSLDAV